MPAQAAVPDLIYVHCNGGGGDFRISELNHTVAQFSARYQQYRPVCPSCEILEWGDRITMKDTTKTYIQFDRMTGDVVIERAGGRLIPGASYRGLCTRGTVVTVKSVRAF
ncbi:MAG: hypothetical protein WDN44_11935 [Sphingomonas sp.]